MSRFRTGLPSFKANTAVQRVSKSHWIPQIGHWAVRSVGGKLQTNSVYTVFDCFTANLCNCVPADIGNNTQRNQLLLYISDRLVFVKFQPGQDILSIILFGIFLLAILFQCFVYCYGGAQLTFEVSLFHYMCMTRNNYIHYKSWAVADAIYESKWYKTKASTRRTICFFLMRSQKCIGITAGFFDASLVTFSSVYK